MDSGAIIAQILQSYVDSLNTYELQISQISQRVLELQVELIDLQKRRDETLKLLKELKRD